MKRNRTHVAAAFTFSAIATFSSGAFAGADTDGCCGNPVVSHELRKAYGTHADARNSDEPLEQIGCEVHTEGPQGLTRSLVCTATSRYDVSASCTSTDDGFIKVAQAIPAFGWTYFEWDREGNCTLLSVRIGSQYLPDITP